jgi:transporter family-2 protein
VPGSIAAVPAWAWLSAAARRGYVASTTLLGPRLGAAVLLVLTLAGQMVSAVLVDHYGWIGFPRNPVSWERTLGIVLVLAGAWLTMRR